MALVAGDEEQETVITRSHEHTKQGIKVQTDFVQLRAFVSSCGHGLHEKRPRLDYRGLRSCCSSLEPTIGRIRPGLGGRVPIDTILDVVHRVYCSIREAASGVRGPIREILAAVLD